MFENNLIDKAYNEYVIGVYSDAPARSSEEVLEETENRVKALVDRVNELYIVLDQTNDEYNEYLGAENISVLSSGWCNREDSCAVVCVFCVHPFRSGRLCRSSGTGKNR